MKFHPGCEFLCVCWALYELLKCFYEILSSLWVAVCLLDSMWITNMPSWNSIQKVSYCVTTEPCMNFWYAFMKSHSDCELMSAPGLYINLICLHEIIFSKWVAVCLLGFIWITNMLLWHSTQMVSCYVSPGLHLNFWYAFMTFYLECVLLYAFWTLLEFLTFPHNLLSRKWGAVCFLGFLWIADMSP